jgi:hypothetical protein
MPASASIGLKSLLKPREQHVRDMTDCIRFLSMDTVEKAKSGHPGAPMGMGKRWTSAIKAHLGRQVENQPAGPGYRQLIGFVLDKRIVRFPAPSRRKSVAKT